MRKQEEAWKGVFQKVIGIAQQANGKVEGDYIGEDGLLYCGKCGTRKQTRVPLDFGGEKQWMTPPVMCRCMREQEEERIRLEQERERDMEIAKLRKASLMDAKFRDSTFANFQKTQDNQKNHTFACRYVDQFERMVEANQGLLLYGSTGTGKTYLAACIANALLSKGVPVVMTSFVKLLDLGQGQRSESDEDVIERINNADLLIVDDLGAERGTDYALERVYNFVDSRYRAKKPMILTTNLTIEEIKGATDIRYQRIYDRVLECCFPMPFYGVSWRRREAGARYNQMKALLEG